MVSGDKGVGGSNFLIALYFEFVCTKINSLSAVKVIFKTVFDWDSDYRIEKFHLGCSALGRRCVLTLR